MVHAALASLSRPARASLFITLVAVGGAFQASCLEANATTAVADGGEGGASKGDSSVSGSGTGTGAGTGTGTGTGTGMDATVSGTDGSTGVDAGPTVPLCLSPSVADKACFECVDTMCTSTVGPAVTACASFYTCFEMCACSDQACITACVTAAPTSCDTPLENLNTCQTTTCGTACNVPDSGSTPPVEAGPPGDAGASCMDPTATQTACGQCEVTNCASVVSTEKSACSGSFDTCFAACSCSDTSCIDSCAEAASTGCQSALEALASCQTGTACKATCVGTATDAGATKDGGGSTGGTIPDCADPTTAEQQLYAACSACDNSKCASAVAGAVSNCTAYYACFAACDCDNVFCQDECELDITTPCNTAIDTLGTCQNESCASDCE